MAMFHHHVACGSITVVPLWIWVQMALLSLARGLHQPDPTGASQRFSVLCSFFYWFSALLFVALGSLLAFCDSVFSIQSLSRVSPLDPLQFSVLSFSLALWFIVLSSLSAHRGSVFFIAFRFSVLSFISFSALRSELPRAPPRALPRVLP